MQIHNLYTFFKILVNKRLILNPTRVNNNDLLLQMQTCILILSLILFSVMMSNSYASRTKNIHSNADEQLKVKAAFILNLARFVEWPEDSRSNENKEIVICFYQYNFLKESVATLLDKRIDNKSIRIKIVHELTINEPCKVLLIPASTLSLFIKHNDVKNLYQKITITDLSGDDEPWNRGNKNSLENKIIFRLKREELRLRFEVNKIASERLGINIGSELLKLGILVEDQEIETQRERP